MKHLDLLDASCRKRIIEEIHGDENLQRKLKSYKQNQMQNDNFYQYVYEYLCSKYDQSTIDEMVIFADVNLQKRISKSEASIYKHAPDRQYDNLSDQQASVIDMIYDDAKANTKLRKSNEAFKFQSQSCMQVVPEDGRLVFKVLKPHHYDVIPDPINPEKAYCYILSAFDYSDYDRVNKQEDREGFSGGDAYRDGANQKIADFDDSEKAKKTIYAVWSKDYNFFMNGKAEILSKETMEPLEGEIEESEFISPLGEFGIMPFIDIASDKEFEFWVRQGQSLYDATLRYNVILTTEQQVVEMQGRAQAFYKGDANHMPDNLRVGTTKVIHIPVDPNNPVDSEFGFVSPSADLASIRDFRESYLAAFLSSRGIDTSTVSGSPSMQKASSGFQQLLQMIEKFEASQEDMDMYEKAEQEAYKIIVAWVKSLQGTDMLDRKYQTALPDIDQTQVFIEYNKPQSVTTEQEQLANIEKKMDMGIYSRIDALMELEKIDKDTAQKRVLEIDEMDGLNQIKLPIMEGTEDEEGDTEAEVFAEGSLPEVQS